MYSFMKIDENRVLGYFFTEADKNHMNWDPGVPWVGPWGPLGLGDPGPLRPWALGTLGLYRGRDH